MPLENSDNNKKIRLLASHKTEDDFEDIYLNIPVSAYMEEFEISEMEILDILSKSEFLDN